MAVTITPIGEATASNPVRTVGGKAAPAPTAEAPKADAAPVSTNSTAAPTEPVKAEKPADGTTTPQAPNETKLAFLARQEKALQKARDAIKAEREQVQKERESITGSVISKADLDIDLFGTLAKAGISMDKLQEKLLNAPQETESVRALRAEVAAMKAEKAAELAKNSEQTKHKYEQHMGQFRDGAKKLAQESPDEYEFISTFGREGAVAERIEQHFEETGILLDIPEAAKMVEDELLEDALRMVKLKKVQAKLTPAPAAETVTNKVASSPKTLTHQNTTNSAPKSETRDEKRARLVAEMSAQVYKAKLGL